MKKIDFSIVLLPIAICLLTLSCSKDIIEDPDTPPADPITFDCVSGSGAEELMVTGDPYNTFTPSGYLPFNGYADPSIRKDPNSNRIWLAYSFPHIKKNSTQFTTSIWKTKLKP